MTRVIMSKKLLQTLGLIGLGSVLGLGAWRWHGAHQQQTEEKVLSIVNWEHPKSLDPIAVNDVYSTKEVARVYEGLVTYNPYEEPTELIPNLATKLPTVSADGLVYTFELRDNVRFHDDACFAGGKGRLLLASDVVYSLKRLVDPQLTVLGNEFIRAKIKGLDAWGEQYVDTPADYDASVEGLEVLDGHTLRITLNQCDPQFLQVLAMPICSVVPREAVEHYGKDFANHPVGTGPFVLEEYDVENDRIIYRKNEAYTRTFPSIKNPAYQELAAAYTGKKLPLVDRLISYIFPSSSEAYWEQFELGELDAIKVTGAPQLLAALAPAQQLAPEVRAAGVQQFRSSGNTVYRFVINNQHPLFKENKKLRQAMSLAFDRKTFCERFFKDLAVPAHALIPLCCAGELGELVGKYTQYKPAQAAQLLAEAGYPGGKGLPFITLHVPDTPEHRAYGEFFKQNMADIGLIINIEVLPFQELTRLGTSGEGMLHWMGWAADYPDAKNFFDLLYGPYSGFLNESHYNNVEFNSLYETAAVLKDGPERTALYDKLCKNVAEEVPEIPVVLKQNVYLYQGWIKNFVKHPFGFTEVYYDVDPARKKTLLGKKKAQKK